MKPNRILNSFIFIQVKTNINVNLYKIITNLDLYESLNCYRAYKSVYLVAMFS